MLQNGYQVNLVHTTKVEVNEGVAGLPPHKGVFKEFLVADYFCPPEWSKDGVFVRVEEDQPLWIDLRMNPACACLPSVQRLNPVTGEPADLEGGLKKDPKQNYLVLPQQMWLDGYPNNGKVYQFVVTKEGAGLAVSEFVLPKHMQDSHAMGFAFYAPKVPPTPPAPLSPPISYSPTWISPPPIHNYKYTSIKSHYLASDDMLCDNSPVPVSSSYNVSSSMLTRGVKMQSALHPECEEKTDGGICLNDVEVGVTVETQDIMEQHVTFDKASMGMGGRIEQGIIPDRNTVDYYHEKPDAILTIYMALPEQFDAIMSKGRRSDSGIKDKYIYSGKVGGIQVPLIK